MLYRTLFIIHGTVKDFIKSYTVVQNEVPQLQKWTWHSHIELL